MDTDLTQTYASFTEALGIRGWSHLEPVLLASLATESPLLMIGPHGTGKSQLIELVAGMLGLNFRHYNASLLNYDDLVGIPMPNADGTALNFIKSPGTIWEAEFVFLDEISRCRADLQNKLFPIIHERRVVGVHLDHLQHRWSAMNPPAPEDLDVNATTQYYLGSEALDPALTDRFPFILAVPTWNELSRTDRRQLVDQQLQANMDTFDLSAAVDSTAALIPELEAEFSGWLGDYIVTLVDLLERNGLPQSPRRARMLARSVVAVHAARLVLEGHEADPAFSAELAIRCGLPQTATDTPPSLVKVVSAHHQAWELSQNMGDDTWRQVVEENDPARRVMKAIDLGFDDENLSRLITHTLSAEDSDTRQIGLAAAMFIKFGRERDLDPSAFEPLAQLTYHIMEPRTIHYTAHNGTPEMNLWVEIENWLNRQQPRTNTLLFRLQRNFILHGYPEVWRRENWQEALEQFTKDMQTFGITDEFDKADENDGDDDNTDEDNDNSDDLSF